MKLIFDEIRRNKGITKTFIIKELRISRGTLENWINGKSYPRLDQAVRLAELLNCEIKDLYEL